MRKKETAPLVAIPEQPEETHLRAARIATDPALRGVYFVISELLIISSLGAAEASTAPVLTAARIHRERRIEGLFRFAERGFPPEQPLLAGLFGDRTAQELIAAWPFIQGMGASYSEYHAGKLTEPSALFRILEAAGAVLAIGGGAEGMALLDELARPAVKCFGEETTATLFERLKRRPLKPTQFRPRGHTADLHAFIRAVARNRMLDNPGASTLRKYKGLGIDTTDSDAVDAFREERQRSKRGLSLGYLSAREAADRLGIPEASFRLAVRRAAKRGTMIGKALPPRGLVQYLPSEILQLRRMSGVLPRTTKRRASKKKP